MLKKINVGNLMGGILVICRPTANRNNRLYFFYNRINSERLRDLFNQYVYVHPDKEIMDEYPSPDELDSLVLCFYGNTNGY